MTPLTASEKEKAPINAHLPLIHSSGTSPLFFSVDFKTTDVYIKSIYKWEG